MVCSDRLQAPLAQLAEQLTLNQRVRGSSPWRRTGGPRNWGLESFPGTAVECRESYFLAFNEWLQNRLSKISWAVGDNYFKSKKTGRVVTQWCDGALTYVLLARFLACPSARVSGARRVGLGEPGCQQGRGANSAAWAHRQCPGALASVGGP
jgi:hypothetical protein